MIKKSFKKFLKNSNFVHRFSVYTLFLYLKLVYLTSKWEFVLPQKWDRDYLNQTEGALFAIWHNRLAFGIRIIQEIENIYALASPHTDGRLVTDIIKQMGIKVISGSTNRNSAIALREIINKINSGNNVIITPDGPRGPVYKINSNITRIAKRFNKPLIPIACMTNKYYELKTWDKMMIPKLFSKVTVYFGEPILLTEDTEANNLLLEKALSNSLEKF